MKNEKLIAAWNKANPDEETIERMYARLNGALPSACPKRKVRKAVFVAIACIMLIGIISTVIAVNYTAQWHSGLLGYFHHPSEQQLEKYEQIVDLPEASATDGGVTVNVLQTVCDGKMLYLLCQVIVPDGIEIKNSIGFERVDFSVNGIEPAGGQVSNITDIIEKTSNSITKVIKYEFTEELQTSGQMSLRLSDLGYQKAAFETLAEGEWSLTWNYTFQDMSKTVYCNEEFSMEREDFGLITTRITTLRLSPISVWIEHDGTPTTMTTYIDVNMKDGTRINVGKVDSIGNRMFRAHPQGKGEMYFWFNQIIDVDQVESVTIGGQTEIKIH